MSFKIEELLEPGSELGSLSEKLVNQCALFIAT